MSQAAPSGGGVSVESLARQFAALSAEVQDLRADVAEVPVLRARIDVLERRRAQDIDPADVDLMRAIAQTIGGRTFTARELWKHAAITPDLSAALVACDVTDPHTLGRVLQRLSHAVGGPLRIERVGDSRAGARWRCVVAPMIGAIPATP